MNEWADGYVSFIHMNGHWIAFFHQDPPAGNRSYPCRVPVPKAEFQARNVADEVVVAEVKEP